VTPARPWTAALIAVLSGLVSWVGLDLWTGGGGTRPPLSWATAAATLALALAVIAAGLPVRRWMRARAAARTGNGGGNGRPPRPARPVDPLVAARTAVLAKAAAYGGSLLVGWFLGQVAVLLPDLVGARRRDLVIGLLALLAAVSLVVAGFVVQHWCRIPPEDDSGAQGEEPVA
jgi:hypothetical protein